MNCQCQGIEELFNQRTVAQDVQNYHRKGPDKTTRWLLEALKEAGVQGLTLLDIGGGVGAIQHDLLANGVQSGTDVDASTMYLQAARDEARERGLADRLRFRHGNFVDLAGQLEPAGVVTLDRVICCYDDMRGLVDYSAARAEKLLGLVYPRDTWWMRLGMRLLNFFMRLRRNPYRGFVHPTAEVDALVRKHGLQQRFHRQGLAWQVVVYAR